MRTDQQFWVMKLIEAYSILKQTGMYQECTLTVDLQGLDRRSTHFI